MSNELTMNDNKTYNLGMSEVEARQVAEIRGKMVLARQFPRDPEASLNRILVECENIKLAESATYSFPRGDSEVKGPSIRLAEVIASYWGNFTCGVTELDQRSGESTVKSYAWDLESNYSDEKVFTVQHVRSTKKGNYQLTDPRDIYELVANQGARRKRACIFSVIPTYLVEAAVGKCNETLENSMNKEDIGAVRTKMLSVFCALDEAITREVMEAKIGKPFDTFNTKDIVKLRNLYNAIKDGFVKVSAAFDLGGNPEEPVLGADDAVKVEELTKSIFADSPFDPDAPDSLTPDTTEDPEPESTEAIQEDKELPEEKEAPPKASRTKGSVKAGDQVASTND